MCVFLLCIMELTYFPFKQCQILLEWLNVSGIHLSPDGHILHLVFHITLSDWISLNLSLSLPQSLPLGLTPSGYLPFHRGPCVTLFIVFFGWLWRTIAVWSLGLQSVCVWICIFPLGVVSSCVKRGYAIYVSLKGLSTAQSQSLKNRGFMFCVCVPACVGSQPVEFYRTKQVKTTHCVCFNVSSWPSLQGCHSQVSTRLETAGHTQNQRFYLYW